MANSLGSNGPSVTNSGEPSRSLLRQDQEASEPADGHATLRRLPVARPTPLDSLAALRPRELAGRWRLRAEVDDPQAQTWVARDDSGEITGFAAAGATRDEVAPIPWELYAINLLPRAQGSGLADELMDCAVGAGDTTLWVLADNERAQAFYRRHGFVAEGARKVHEGIGVPELRMIRRRLPDGRPVA